MNLVYCRRFSLSCSKCPLLFLEGTRFGFSNDGILYIELTKENKSFPFKTTPPEKVNFNSLYQSLSNFFVLTLSKFKGLSSRWTIITWPVPSSVGQHIFELRYSVLSAVKVDIIWGAEDYRLYFKVKTKSENNILPNDSLKISFFFYSGVSVKMKILIFYRCNRNFDSLLNTFLRNCQETLRKILLHNTNKKRRYFALTHSPSHFVFLITVLKLFDDEMENQRSLPFGIHSVHFLLFSFHSFARTHTFFHSLFSLLVYQYIID
jgi:hypothetical protein